jgi:hypothetical protein
MVWPGLASAGTRNVVVNDSGPPSEIVPGYVSASAYCHHVMVSASRSGSLAVARMLTDAPGAADTFRPLVIDTCGS